MSDGLILHFPQGQMSTVSFRPVWTVGVIALHTVTSTYFVAVQCVIRGLLFKAHRASYLWVAGC